MNFVKPRGGRAIPNIFAVLISVFILSLSLASQAAPVSPVSYDMPNGGTGTYQYHDVSYSGSGNVAVDYDPLSGGLGNLTDGLFGAPSLPNPAAGEPWVGWRDIFLPNPTITFYFSDTTSFSTVTVRTWDEDGSVGIPSSITVQVAGNAPRNFAFSNPAGQGIRTLNLDMMGDTGNQVTVTLNHSSYTWLFVDEISFDGELVPGMTEVVSVNDSLVIGNATSQDAVISRDGRFVAFSSWATNLVTPSSPYTQAYVRDRLTGTTEMVSLDFAGNPPTYQSFVCAISDDGRYVGFRTAANMGPGTGGRTLVYIHDRDTNTTEHVSIGYTGALANSTTDTCAISEDGRFVAFRSWGSNLVPGDTNGLNDIFVRDRVNGTTERVSLSTGGSQANYNIDYGPDISPDGRFVVFNTRSWVGFPSIMVHDRNSSTTTAVNRDTSGNLIFGDNWTGLRGNVISDDGRFVVWYNWNQRSVFVRDLINLTTERVDVDSSGVPGNNASFWSTISGDGRYVAFYGGSTNLVVPDANGSQLDVFVRDRIAGTTTLISRNDAGDQGNSDSYVPVISGDGGSIAFISSSTNLDALVADTNGATDVFAHDIGASNTPPTAVAGANPNPAECGQDITFSGAGSSDADGTIVAWTWSGDISGSGVEVITGLGVGSWNVNLMVEDDGGLTDSTSISGSVVDSTPPVVSAGPDVTLEATSAAGAPYTVPWSVTDSCDPSPSSAISPVLSTYPITTTTVTVTGTDDSGNSASETADITVQDTTAPDVTVPADITEEAVSPSGNAISFSASATDIVDGPLTPTCSPASGSTFGIMTTLVNCSATDAALNTGSAGFNVTVQDTTPPVLSLPSDITEEATSGAGATVSWTATATDVADATVDPVCTPPSGSLFALGTASVSCTSTDDTGNSASGSFNVNVVDTTPPTVTPPADQTLEATSASGAVAVFSASATDIVDGPVAASCSPLSGSTFPLGSTSVTCSATDAASNTGQATATITVQDTTAPALTLPADILVEATSFAGTLVNYIASATDAVDAAPSVDCALPSGSTFPLGSHTVNCSATDFTGNSSNGSFQVNVVDTTPPALSLPADITTEATSFSGALVNYTASATDAVDAAPVVVCAAPSGSTFALGSHTVSCSATDFTGNASNGSFQVNIVDTTPPVLSLPSPAPFEATSAAGAVATFAATASDIADPAPAVVCTPPSGSTFAIGTTAVSCTATDASGNSAGGSFNIVVEDTTAPAVTAPADVTVEATGPLTPAAIGTATATDAVGVVSVVADNYGPYPVGTTTVTWTATDAAGNAGTATQSVTITDTTPPVVTAPADITTTATMPSGAIVNWTIADAVDIVDGAITPTCSPASGSVFGHGTSPVTCTAQDVAGNTGSASFNVTVLNAQPTADPQSVNLDEDTSLAITLTGNDVDAYPLPLSFHVVVDPSNGSLAGAAPNLTYTPNQHFFGSDSFTFHTYDGDLYSETVTVDITIDPVNDMPVITIDRDSASMQYSDEIGTVTITATDVDDDPLSLSSSYTVNGGAPIAGLPSALGTSGSCSTTNTDYSPVPGTSCSWTFSGQALVPSGDYDVTFVVTDAGGGEGVVLNASDVTELLVAAENTSIAFDGGNPVAVQVVADGVDESEPFSIMFDVRELQPDNAAFAALEGDISNAIPEVSMQLTPVGPGGPVAAACSVVDNGVSGYAEVLTFTCDFDAVPVNTYSVDVSVNGGYYTGSNDDVLTVYDPSLGFTTGGGWFYWPGTTDKTNFGYTMKYNKKRSNIQGSLLMIRRIEGAPEGEDKWRIKSNALEGLSLGDETDFGWAAFSGKATYRAPGEDNEGNHEFTVLVEDHGEPGAGLDKIWVQTRDKADDVIIDLSMDEPPVDNVMTIEGGNIVVPHGRGGGGSGGGGGKGKKR